MKNNTISFLFFVTAIFSIVVDVYGQQKIDSLDIYKKSLIVNNLHIDAYDYFDKGAIYESEYATVEAIKLLDNLPENTFNIQSRIGLYNHLGMIYRRLENYNSALEYYRKSLKLNNTLCDSVATTNNIANILSDKKLYNEAIKTLSIVYEKSLKLDNCKGKWTIIDNLGFNESKLEIPEALEKMKIALNGRIKDSLDEGIFSSYKHLAIYYADRSQIEKSLSCIIKAIVVAKKIKSPAYYKEALYFKLKLSQDVEVLKYLQLSDSINTSNKQIENKYVNKQYDNERLEKENAEKELEVSEEKRIKNISILVTILTILGIISLLFYFKQRNKIVRSEERHKTERNFSKKVHDELGNDIFYLMNQLQMNPASLLEKEGMQILNDLNGIYEKARDISKRYTSIHTDKGYHDELLSLLNSYGSETTKIVTKEVTSDFWDAVSKLKKEQVYRVLQELLTNMKKHSKATLVGVTFTKIKKQIIIKYVDNGKGATREQLLAKNGLGNVENRIEEMNGTITFDTSPDNGFKAEIRFIQ